MITIENMAYTAELERILGEKYIKSETNKTTTPLRLNPLFFADLVVGAQAKNKEQSGNYEKDSGNGKWRKISDIYGRYQSYYSQQGYFL